MHDSSLPAADRNDAPQPAGDERPRRPALVIAMALGGFFKAWRADGTLVIVSQLARARLFSPGTTIEATLKKLRNKRLEAKAIEVQVVIGQPG